MGDFPFNQAKGRFAEWAERSRTGADANGALVLALFNSSATDATLIDLDTLAAIESNANTAELTSGTNANYVRKTVSDGNITVTIDDTNDRVDVDAPDQTWTALGAGTAVTDLFIGYDADTTGGTDANVLPGTWHDFAVTPDGSDVTAQFPTGGFYRAS